MPLPIHVTPSVRTSAPPAPTRRIARHELHRAIDGDWDEPAAPPDQRPALAMGLAVIASLPVVSLLFAQWPAAPRLLAAAIASLPLVALLCVAAGWRAMGGRS